MEISAVQSAKLFIVSATGLSKDALHIYVGLSVFLVVALLAPVSRKYLVACLTVLAVALLGEILDMRDDLRSLGHWRWGASLHDVVNTLFWPTVLAFILGHKAKTLNR